MKDCVISAINGDVHIDGNSMTPDEWEQLRARADTAAHAARLQRARILAIIAHSPAIPRCSTCEQWELSKSADGRALTCCVSTWLPKAPDDYCSSHSGLRK